MKYRKNQFPIHYCDNGECMPLMKTRLNKCDLFASNITTESPYKYELPRGLCRKKHPRISRFTVVLKSCHITQLCLHRIVCCQFIVAAINYRYACVTFYVKYFMYVDSEQKYNRSCFFKAYISMTCY